MRVLVEDVLFQIPASTPLLITLFFHAIRDRHRVVADPNGPYRAWAARLDDDTRKFCDNALDFSALAESLEPAVIELRVVAAGTPSWRPPRLPLVDALELLQRPYKILVEDARSDRAFLLAMCTPEQRQFFEDRERRGLLEFVHGGGVSSMNTVVEALANDDRAQLTTFVLFDSDALRPGVPSPQSEQLRAACTPHIAHHQLRRRFIESYLPLRALSDWAGSIRNSKKRKKRRHRFAALARLTPAQRHFYNMKKGFLEDDKRAKAAQTAGALYDGVDHFTREALAHGLDAHLSALFHPPGARFSERDLKDDGSWQEGSGLAARLVELAR